MNTPGVDKSKLHGDVTVRKSYDAASIVICIYIQETLVTSQLDATGSAVK